MQGKLIVFEGVEGSGKTTQLQRSQEWLLSHPLVQQLQQQGHFQQLIVTREPGGTEIGQAIRRLLLTEVTAAPLQHRAELLLYAADRAQHISELLKPQIEKGALILCDRFTDSTLAYQGYGRGFDLDLIHQLNQIATGGLQSNLTLWLDLDVEQGLVRTKKRGTADRMEQDSLQFHQRVQQGFRELANAFPSRIVRIDASGTEEEVAQQVQAVLEHHLAEWYQALLLPS